MSALETQVPSRPSIPPFFIAAACSWLAVCMAEALFWESYAEPDGLPALTLAIACAPLLVGAIAFAALRKNAILAAMLAYLIALACGSIYWHAWATSVQGLQAVMERGPSLELELTGDPAARDYGTVSNACVRNGLHTTQVRLIWPDGSSALSAGHMVMASGSLLSPQANESGRWAHQNGFAGTLKASTVEDAGYAPGLRGLVAPFRDSAFERVSTLGGDAAPLLAGMLLGNKTLYANSELEQAFQTTGLAHLMAVSGTHLAVVTMLLATLLARTRARRRARNAILPVALVLYVALTGFSASALRACTMCGIALLAGSLSRRKSTLNNLSLCVFAFLGHSPPIAFSLGFQLSVLSILGLVLFGPLIQAWATHIMPSRTETVATTAAATIAATFLTMPATIAQFAQLPLISPISNIIAAPLVTAALSLGLVGVLLGFVPVAETLLLHLAGTLASCCACLVRLLAGMPGACMPLSSNGQALALAFTVLAAILWAVWPLPRNAPATSSTPVGVPTRTLTLALACSLLALPVLISLASGFGQHGTLPFGSQSRVVMLDVGQGDSMLIVSMGSAILVDTGEDGQTLIRQLAQQGIAHLDAIVITHKDSDHAGALSELAGIVGVDHVYVHDDLVSAKIMESVSESAQWVTRKRGAEGLKVGDSIRVGEFTLRLVAPERGGTSANDDSLVCLLEFDAACDGSIEARGILTGDAEADAMAIPCKRVGDVDFLKVAHHGSRGGLTDDELAMLSPEIALISVGAGNRYGHPTTSTLRQLEHAGARICRTDEQGTITLGFTEDTITMQTRK